MNKYKRIQKRKSSPSCFAEKPNQLAEKRQSFLGKPS